MTAKGLEVADTRFAELIAKRNEELRGALFRGKLIMPCSLLQVSENNGQDGRPTWVYLGEHVMDVTNALGLTGRGALWEDVKTVIKVAITLSGDVGLACEAAGMDVLTLAHILLPFRCAILAKSASQDGKTQNKARGRTADIPMTVKELARHAFSQFGCHAAIEGSVYDIAGTFGPIPLLPGVSHDCCGPMPFQPQYMGFWLVGETKVLFG